ncbi:MAG: hypothetical protein FJX56_14455 [Alphaproteobacteria bacterium]|nr:hypothetical protein [Alphaproteobacteria bacterium]
MANRPTVKITRDGDDKISITFPKGTRAAIRAEVPLDELLQTLGGPEPDVEGQGENPIRTIGVRR